MIPDDEKEIVEASRRMVDTYDLVITSGGIGPTHDGRYFAFIDLLETHGMMRHYIRVTRQGIPYAFGPPPGDIVTDASHVDVSQGISGQSNRGAKDCS